MNAQFNPIACACFQLMTCDVNCAEKFPATPVQNPLESCECISSESFNLLFAHGLENCGADDTGTDIGTGGGDGSGTGGGDGSGSGGGSGTGDGGSGTGGGSGTDDGGATEDCPEDDEEFNTALC